MTSATCKTMLETVNDLAPLIERSRDEIERTRGIPPALLEALRDADILRLWYPAKLGGPELTVEELGLVLERLAYLDGAVGWCAGINTSYSRFAGYLPEPIAREIFEHDVVAGGLAATGKGVKVPGGYRISGRWKWGSGISHSNWVVASFNTYKDDDQANDPELHIAFFPKHTGVDIIDTWTVTGLRGTGSYDYAVHDLFVPDDHAVRGLDPPPQQPTALYRIPLATAYPFIIAAAPLGMAMAAIDAFVTIAQTKSPVSMPTLLRDRPSVQAMVGRSRAALLGAREFYYATARDVMRTAETREPFSLDLRTRARLAAALVGDVAKQVVRDCYDAAGGASVYATCRLEQLFRDIHTACQHVQVSPNNFEFSGRVLLGLSPGTARF